MVAELKDDDLGVQGFGAMGKSPSEVNISCTSCGESSKGVQFRVKILSVQDLNRHVVKSCNATVEVPEIQLEISPEEMKGELNTVEGILKNVILTLRRDQTDGLEIEAYIKRIQDLLNLNRPFQLFLTDPSGNSFVENLHATRLDSKREVLYFERTSEQNRKLNLNPNGETNERRRLEKVHGACALSSPTTSIASSTSPLLRPDEVSAIKCSGTMCDADQATVGSRRERKKDDEEITDSVEDLCGYIENPADFFHNEALSFHTTNCSRCFAPATSIMKVTSIPHFKEVIVMTSVCDFCGHKTNEVNSEGNFESHGKQIKLKVTSPDDLRRSLVKSETCSLIIPELELEIGSKALTGKFTTLEGLLKIILEQIDSHRLYNSIAIHRIEEFKSKLFRMMKGRCLPFTFIMDDPCGNSFLQNPFAPAIDSELEMTEYDRLWNKNKVPSGVIKIMGHEMDTSDRDVTKPSNEVQHLVEIGRAGRYLYTHDEPFSALTSPLNHAGRDFRRHSGSRSAKSVSSPCGVIGIGPGSQAGGATVRTGSASPGES